MKVKRFCRKLRMLAPAWLLMIAYTFAADTALIEPHSLIVDCSLPRAQINSAQHRPGSVVVACGIVSSSRSAKQPSFRISSADQQVIPVRARMSPSSKKQSYPHPFAVLDL